MLGLRCYVGFSLVAVCVGFLLRWPLLLKSTGSRACKLQELQTWAQHLWFPGSTVVAPRA